MIYTITPSSKLNILTALQQDGIAISANCGGTGRCGQCAIRVVSGYLDITAHDRECFSEKELDAGWRLACSAYTDSRLTIEIPEEKGAEILAEFSTHKDVSITAEDNGSGQGHLYAAIDLGTTTVAIVLYDAEGRPLETQTFLNPQRSFGADVISRIKAATEGNADILAESIRRGIVNSLNSILPRFRDLQHLTLVLAGNTAMIQLLLKLDCSGLTKYPFTPMQLEMVKEDALFLFPGLRAEKGLTTELIIFPGSSAFIGGDIISGMYGLGFDEVADFRLTSVNNTSKAGAVFQTAGAEPCSTRVVSDFNSTSRLLLVDLGTNGEMVLAANGRLISTSAAAGPAFEGGNISCGMGCIEGAIDHISDTDSNCTDTATSGTAGTSSATCTVRYSSLPCCHVIGKPESTYPEGLCGSGLLELTDWMLTHGIVDSTGAFTAPDMQEFTFAQDCDGNPLTLTQADLRELQTAKSAIRAAINVLLSADCASRTTSETSVPQISLYLAGGMGTGIIPAKIRNIGLLPEAADIIPVGNSCLAGLNRYIRECISGKQAEADATLLSLARHTEYVDLAENSVFTRSFIENMNFPIV